MAESSGFVKDENGRWTIVPWRQPDFSVKKDSSGKKTCNNSARKYIPIERLVFNPADFDDAPSSKKRKIEKPVRKELFKVPQRKSKIENRFSSSNKQSRKLELPKKSTVFNHNKDPSKQNYSPLNDGSPLLDIDRAEELLSKHSFVRPIPKIVTTDYSENIPPRTKLFDINEHDETQCSSDSEKSQIEFLQFEKNFATSPVTSVCSLLENTKINRSGGKTPKKFNIIEQIKAIIKKDENEFESLKVQVQKYEKERLDNSRKITQLLAELENCNDKENHRRRSDRIAAKVNASAKKILQSPSNLKSVDLRKATLNKNLSKNLQNDTQSPRSRKAADMYNNIRNNYSVLCTPKLDRTNIDLSQASVTKSLSRRIQKQCLLLQDTPR